MAKHLKPVFFKTLEVSTLREHLIVRRYIFVDETNLYGWMVG